MIKVGTLCSGYDSQCLALERLKRDYPEFDYELSWWSEIDKHAIKAHDALFPQWKDRNLGDMTQIDWTKCEKVDLLFYSTPCFVAGTKILTAGGYKSIEEVQVGDEVLTHKNRFRKVTAVGKKPYHGDMVKIYGMSIDVTYCTKGHPFYVRRMYRMGKRQERRFHEPEWIKAGNLDMNCYLGYAINTKSELPRWEGTTDNRWGHNKPVNHLSELMNNEMFWYVMGRYVGDGWMRNSSVSSGIIICCSERNRESLVKALETIGFNYTEVKERTVKKIHICSKELNRFVERYGHYAHGKKIDDETMNLPKNLLRFFLKGYIDSDGCIKGNTIKTTSVSRELCLGIGQCVTKVYERPFALYRVARPDKYVIEGRVVNQKDSYNIVWKTTNDKQDKAFYEDGYVWFPLSKMPMLHQDEVEVYNMSVEEDESYTANGAIVHNCQSISQAGLQHGFVEGSGTRSSIIWNVKDALTIIRPKFAVLENVSAMVSAKFIDMFNLWQLTIEGLGYKNYAQVLNAKCYGVPQNRDRIFLVSIREDVDLHFYFPNPFKLKKRLVDVLEDDVDEKYYISDTALNGYVEHNKRHIDKGTGFLFQPKDIEEDGGGIANTIRANGAVCPTDNHIIVKSNKNVNMKLIGKITLGKEAMISDPRYSSAYSEDNNYLCKNVEDGEFECYVDEDVHLDRVKRIVVKKSDADVKDVDMHRVGVDSAMIGIFDYEYFKKSRVDYGIRPDAWLERCFRLFQDQDSFIIDEQGFVSISGFGDGEYDLLVGKNKGKAVYFEITFIKDE